MNTTMDIEYTWVLCQGKGYHQFRLLGWSSFIGQFFHLVGGKRDGVRPKGVDVGEYYFSQL